MKRSHPALAVRFQHSHPGSTDSYANVGIKKRFRPQIPIFRQAPAPPAPSLYFPVQPLMRLYENEARFISNFYAVMSRFGSAKARQDRLDHPTVKTTQVCGHAVFRFEAWRDGCARARAACGRQAPPSGPDCTATIAARPHGSERVNSAVLYRSQPKRILGRARSRTTHRRSFSIQSFGDPFCP